MALVQKQRLEKLVYINNITNLELLKRLENKDGVIVKLFYTILFTISMNLIETIICIWLQQF